jgi:hypothetical protein
MARRAFPTRIPPELQRQEIEMTREVRADERVERFERQENGSNAERNCRDVDLSGVRDPGRTVW